MDKKISLILFPIFNLHLIQFNLIYIPCIQCKYYLKVKYLIAIIIIFGLWSVAYSLGLWSVAYAFAYASDN